MTPRFDRTRRFAIPAAMLGVDGVFTIVWLSAFATQASYNAQDLCGKVCGVSKAIVALGVFITYVNPSVNVKRPMLIFAACYLPARPSSAATP